MNRDLVEWECGFQDCWDSQGHYTKDTEPAPYVWGLALDLADGAVAAGECLTLDINTDDDTDLAIGVFLTAFCIYVDATDVAWDDAFDNDEELLEWASSMVDIAYTAKESEWSLSRTHERVFSSMEEYFG